MQYKYSYFDRQYYDAEYDSEEVYPYIEEQIMPLIKSNNFYWADLFDFYATYHFWKKKQDKPSYVSLDKIVEILKAEKIDANWLDLSGNHFLNFLCSICYEARGREDSKINLLLFKNDIDRAIKLVKEPLLKNKRGIHFFWNLSNISFAGIEPATILGPIIKKYKINVFEPIANGQDLLDKAVSTGWGVHIDFYLKLGLKIEGREYFLENFISFPVNHEKTMRLTYQKALSLYDPFNKLFYRETGYQEKENLISLWTSFLLSSPDKAKYADNLIFTLDLINRGEVKIEKRNYKTAKQTLLKACKALEENIHYIKSKNLKNSKAIIDSCIPSFERWQIDNALSSKPKSKSSNTHKI